MQALRVKFVWCEGSCTDAAFCAWAGRVLADKELLAALAPCTNAFSVLVHNDARNAIAGFLSGHNTAEVRLCVCRRRQLLHSIKARQLWAV